MRPYDQRLEFIRLRAEGRAYSYIGEKLEISKDTCHKWEAELKTEINTTKQEALGELYNQYHMTRQARIKRLGDTLNRIEDALAGKDLTQLPAERLLEYRLRYAEALQTDYADLTSHKAKTKNIEADDLIGELASLINRLRDGEISTDQASKEGQILGNMLKAYEATELKDKVDELQAVVRGRK
jgi:hypothetical protein